MSNRVEALLAEIGALDLEGLRRFWGELYGAPPPLRSVALLRLMLAWRLQAAASGGLTPEVRRSLQKKGALRAQGLDLGIGACLTRTWQGRTVEVVVEADGFRWEGRSYRSLSSVASAIAGSRWNGPRFFGLRDGA